MVGIYRPATSPLTAAPCCRWYGPKLLVLGDGVHEVVVVTETDRSLRAPPNSPHSGAFGGSRLDRDRRAGADGGDDVGVELHYGGDHHVLDRLLIINTLLMSVYDAPGRPGLLISLGLQPSKIVQMILLESGLMGLVSCALGVALGWCAHLAMVYVGFPLEVERKGLSLTGYSTRSFVARWTRWCAPM